MEYLPPLMVNEDSGFGTGQLPDKEGQMYHIGIDNLYLIPTAEVPVTNIFRDVILDESELPVKSFVTTNTIHISQDKKALFGDRLEVLSIGPMLGEVIQRANEGRSVGEMFNE